MLGTLALVEGAAAGATNATKATSFLEAVAGNKSASTCTCSCGCLGDCASCCGGPANCCCGMICGMQPAASPCCATCQKQLGLVKVGTYSSPDCTGSLYEGTYVSSVCTYVSDGNYIKYTCQDGGNSVLYEQHTKPACTDDPIHAGTVAVRSCHAPTSGEGQSEDISCVPPSA